MDPTTDPALREQIVAEDRRLEQQATASSLALMQFRWHWTLDESHPQRMSLRAYAAAIDRSFATVYRYAKGYDLLLSDTERGITPDEARERAGMSVELEQATEAVAAARGVSFHQAREKYGSEIQSVRKAARAQVEAGRFADSATFAAFADAARKDATMSVQDEQARQRKEKESKRRPFSRWAGATWQLRKARDGLKKAAREIEGVNFDADERDLLAASLQELIHEAQKLVEMASAMRQEVLGNRVPDWRSMLHVVNGDQEEPAP